MKSIFSTIMNNSLFNFAKRLAIVCVLLSYSATAAAGHSTHYSKATVSANPTGGGTVYVSTTSTKPTSPIEEAKQNCNGNSGNDSQTYYFWADANQGYTFMNFSDGTTTYNNVSAQAIPVKATSTNQSKPTELSVVANFSPIIAGEEEIVMYKMPGGSLSQGTAEVTLNKTTSLGIECTRSDLFEVTSATPTGATNEKITISVKKKATAGDIPLGKVATLTLTPANASLLQEAYNPAQKTITITIKEPLTVTFNPAVEGGYYTYQQTSVEGPVVDVTTQKEIGIVDAQEGVVELKAYPTTNYRFRRWVIEREAAEPEYLYEATVTPDRFNSDATVTAEFVDTKYAQFIVLGTDTAKYKYAHLEDAIAVAQRDGKNVVAVYVPGRLKITSKTTKQTTALIFTTYTLSISSIVPEGNTEWILPKPSSGTYTIPSGITFLVPGLDKAAIQNLIDNTTVREGYVSYHNITYRCNTGAGVNDDFLELAPTPKCICKLSVEDGTKIEVNGAISVFSSASAVKGYTGRPTGYGQLHLGENSTIEVNAGGILHVLGYVTGKNLNSTVTAHKGATVYEAFQFRDWRGGTATMAGFSDFVKNEVFPISQYYMQSIETKLILEYGSKEVLIAAVDVSSPFPVSPEFTDTIKETITSSGAIKEGNLGLFLLGEGTRLEKYYDFAKDSLNIKIVGESNASRAKLNYMYLDVNGGASVGDYSLDSRQYVLPVNHNIAITVDNVQLESPYKFAFMPGSRLEVTPTAHLKIQNKVYVYDAELNVRPTDPTKGYCSDQNLPIMPITYTSQGAPTARTSEKLRYPTKMKDATFIIDGTLTMEDAKIVVDNKDVNIQGMLHTTTDDVSVTGIVGDSVKIKEDFGANITSNANGVINFNRLGSTTPVKQIKQNGTTIEGYEPIPVCNAWLRNSDKTRTGGTTAAVGDTYMYINGFWQKPTATLSNAQGTNFVVTLPNSISQEVVCDEVGNNATITNVQKTSVEGTLFEVGDVKRQDGKVIIPVTYKPNGVHNAGGTPNKGTIHLLLTYKDVLGISHTTPIEVNLTGTENYKPAFSVAINGTPMQNGETYPTIQGTGVGETSSLSVVITPNPNNITTTDKVDWIDAVSATAAPFAFAYGEADAFLSEATLSYTPTAVSENDPGTLTIRASYPNGGTPIDSTIVIHLSAKVGYKPNTLWFATFPSPVYETTEPFLLLDDATNNARTKMICSASPEGIVQIIGDGTADNPYKVKPIAEGLTTITVKQIASSSVEGKEITAQINVTRDDYVLQSVPFCIDNNTVFNTHLYNTTGVTYNAVISPYTIDFNSTSAVSTWQFQFLGMPDKLIFTPSGVNAWRIREGKPVTAGVESTIEWSVVTEWTNLTSGTPVSYTLQPTTRYVEISYGATTPDIGKIVGDVCVTALTIRTQTDKLYMPIYYTTDVVTQDSVVFTHTSASAPTISVNGINASPKAPKKFGTDKEPYYETVVLLQAPATTAEGTYALTATQNTNSATVNVTTYKFPQELPIKLATDKPDNGDRYYFVTAGSRYAQWDATKRQIVFQNPGSQVARSVTFAFNGAPSIITFDVSSMEGAQTINNADWTIYESKDGKDFQPASLAKRDSIEDNTLVQELNYTTRYIRVEYNAQSTREVYLSNLVIEGYPQAIVHPDNLFFTSEETKHLLYMIAINLQKVDFEIDNATAFQMTTDTTSTATDWKSMISATEQTHSTALGQNKVDTIFLAVRWSQQTALDEGKITIKSKTNDSILTIIPLVGSDNYLTIDKAENTGLSTGIPDEYTYHGNQYTDYEYHEVTLTNAFAKDGTALFDYLFIYDETTPSEGTNITPPGTDGSLDGSNAVTPLVVYRKALNTDNQYKGYQFVEKISNVNVSDKAEVGDIIIKDTANVIHINVQDTALRVYMTGFCPYATTGYTKNQEGVFLFRGSHGAKLDVYLENFYVSSRNKTRNGNAFYGNKDGGETYSESYSRGSGGVLVFENVDAQEQLQNFTPFEVSIHTIGDNMLNSNHGCFFALKIGEATAMKAYQVSSPLQVHMQTKDHINQTKTTINIDDIWPTAVDANNVIVDSCRTNGFLALKKQANNAPSIDLGNANTIVNFKGGRVQLQNSQIGSDTYKTTLAISYRAGFFGSEEAGIKLCHGIGTDAVDGIVNFLDGTVTVERMKVDNAYRQYYLMDTLPNGTESEYTTCLRTPKNTFVRGGSICRVRACQHVTSKGGAPKDTKTGSLLGQYVYTMQSADQLNANGSVKSIAFPDTLAGLKEYQKSRNYTYGLKSVTPDVNNNLYFWVPEGYGNVTIEKDVFMATWKACMTKIGAGIANVADGEIGGDIEIISDEEVQNFLYCQLDDNIYNVINAGPVIDGKKSYTYQAPIEVPAAAKEFFKGNYTRWAPNLVGPAKQHEVTSDSTYTIANRVYYITTATADIWQTFTAPFDVENIYVVETYSEKALEDIGNTAVLSSARDTILKVQAVHNADFAAFFGVAMAMGSMKDFDGIYDSYIKWAKIEDDSLGLSWDNGPLRGKQELVPYIGKNWREANFYLNENKGNWGLTQEVDSFAVQWEMLTVADTLDGILLHKGRTYSMLFPYCVGCEDAFGDRDYWDYWSGKFLIFESVAAPQTINGRDFLDPNKSGSIFVDKPNIGEVIVKGNSTFANMNAIDKDIYVFDNYYPAMNEECFEPVSKSGNKVVYPTTAFLYGNVPTNALGMPARSIGRTGKINYGKENTSTDVNQGGNIPTVGGGNDLFITATVAGVNIAVAEPQHVRVMSATGAIIYSGMVQTAVDVALPATGVYVITGENEVHKILH